MKKLLIFFLILFLAFCLGVYYVFTANWYQILKVDKLAEYSEARLGDVFWNSYSQNAIEIKNSANNVGLDSIVAHICLHNQIDKSKIKLHVLESKEVNAFAMPNGHLAVFTGLINQSDNQSELAGVICHELAHIQQKHVMKKIVKELGLSVIISIFMGTDGQQMLELAKLFSSTAYDRSLETEADKVAVSYLLKANINPIYFANFLKKIDHAEDSSTLKLDWLATHPDSGERAKKVMDGINKINPLNQQIISHQLWTKMKANKMIEQNTDF